MAAPFEADERLHVQGVNGRSRARRCSCQQRTSSTRSRLPARVHTQVGQVGRRPRPGEQTDHITDAVFRGKIQGMEQEASAKYGKAVRYSVQTRGREVQLLAMQLG